MAQTWVMMISELRRYQGVCYKSDITVISGEQNSEILFNILGYNISQGCFDSSSLAPSPADVTNYRLNTKKG